MSDAVDFERCHGLRPCRDQIRLTAPPTAARLPGGRHRSGAQAGHCRLESAGNHEVRGIGTIDVCFFGALGGAPTSALTRPTKGSKLKEGKFQPGLGPGPRHKAMAWSWRGRLGQPSVVGRESRRRSEAPSKSGPGSYRRASTETNTAEAATPPEKSCPSACQPYGIRYISLSETWR